MSARTTPPEGATRYRRGQHLRAVEADGVLVTPGETLVVTDMDVGGVQLYSRTSGTRWWDVHGGWFTTSHGCRTVRLVAVAIWWE